MIGIVVAFAMAAVNLLMAFLPGSSVAWFSWLVCGICAGMGIQQVMYRVMDR